jgi:hypothetical protein
LLHLLQDEQFLLEEAEETQRRDVEQAAPDLLALAIVSLFGSADLGGKGRRRNS